MIIAQFDSDQEQATYLMLILERENLDRMKLADPITLESGAFLKPITYPANFHLMIAYEDEVDHIYALAHAGKNRELLKYVMRGYKFIPVDGKLFTLPKNNPKD